MSSGPPPLTRAEAQERSRLIQVASYDVSLDLTGSKDRVRSRTTVSFACTEPGADTFVEVAALDLHSAELNGRPLPESAFTRGRLALTDLAAENRLVVEADMPVAQNGDGFFRYVDPADGQDYVMAIVGVTNAQRIFACFDQPDLKATISTRVRTPAGWVVSGCGPVLSGDAESGEWVLAASPRISPYLFVLAAGPWHVVPAEHRGVAIDVLARRSLAPHLDREVVEILEITRASLDRYAEIFTEPFPFSTMHSAFVPGVAEIYDELLEERGQDIVRYPFVADASAPSTVSLRELALTLFRGTGYLSRSEMYYRPNAAGPLLPVEGAQVRQPLTLTYAVVPHRGDWAANVAAGVEPGGWFFEYANAWYPDVDDTVMVAMALRRIGGPANIAAAERGVRWILAMQNDDGGWAAFDKTKHRQVYEYVPFADHNAIQDPSCPDITGRVLECLSWHGLRNDHPAIRRAVQYIESKQEPEGCFFGRWGVNYIYGTWQAVIGPIRCGVSRDAAWIKRAGAWVKSVQKADGSFGESANSYEDPSLKGKGPSTASQTAWGAMILQEVYGPSDPDLRRAIDWLSTLPQVALLAVGEGPR